METNKHSLYDSILQQIRLAITENKLKQNEVGEALGLSQGAVSFILTGKTKMTMDQFIALSALIGRKPQQVIGDAENSLTEKKPMPKSLEDVLYKSTLHLLAYCASVRPTKPKDLVNHYYTMEKAKAALEDLHKVGIVEKKGESYLQKRSNVSYFPADDKGLDRQSNTHQLIIKQCGEIWEKNRHNKPYRAKRFNYNLIELFKPSQVREVEEILWRVYERIQAFQRENMTNGYDAGTEDFSVWQMNLMLMTPIEDK